MSYFEKMFHVLTVYNRGSHIGHRSKKIITENSMSSKIITISCQIVNKYLTQK